MFQRLMVLRPPQHYTTAYLDNKAIYSANCGDHMQQVQTVLQSLVETGLSANLAKWKLTNKEVTCLGYM